MSIPPRPRFQRPPPRPSDWEPVPIPQPVDAIHTSDPETPTLRQLAERERQRASLVANPAVEDPEDVGPKPHLSTTGGLCTATGLATPERAATYQRGMQQLLQKDWAGLNTPQRIEHVRQIVNAQLRDAGVPEIKVRAAPQLGATGYFYADDWRLDLDDAALGVAGETLPSGRQLDLMRTVYHEARHAEQSYLVARSRAALGETPAAFARALGMKDVVAATAAADPLPKTRPAESSQNSGAAGPDGNAAGTQRQPSAGSWADARGGCADKWYRSVAGEDSAARRQLLLVDMPQASAASKAAAERWEAEKNTHGAYSPEERQAWHAFETAGRAAEAVYERYRKLPEEADAWAVQGLIR